MVNCHYSLFETTLKRELLLIKLLIYCNGNSCELVHRVVLPPSGLWSPLNFYVLETVPPSTPGRRTTLKRDLESPG